MQRVAFKMKLFKGFEEEYQRRHHEIWPELVGLLKENNISDYSIFLDPETNLLFGYLKIDDPEKLDRLPAEAIMQKWWAYMKEIMPSHEDNSPESVTLKEVFYLP